jgi:hypothetical protein
VRRHLGYRRYESPLCREPGGGWQVVPSVNDRVPDASEWLLAPQLPGCHCSRNCCRASFNDLLACPTVVGTRRPNRAVTELSQRAGKGADRVTSPPVVLSRRPCPGARRSQGELDAAGGASDALLAVGRKRGCPGHGGRGAELGGADVLAGRWDHGWRVRIRLPGNPIREGGPGPRDGAGPPGAGQLRVETRWPREWDARAPASLCGTRHAGDHRNPEPCRDAAHDNARTHHDDAQPASHANYRRSVRGRGRRSGPSEVTVSHLRPVPARRGRRRTVRGPARARHGEARVGRHPQLGPGPGRDEWTNTILVSSGSRAGPSAARWSRPVHPHRRPGRARTAAGERRWPWVPWFPRHGPGTPASISAANA